MTSATGWRGSAASYAKLVGGLSRRQHAVQLITAPGRLSTGLAAEGLPVTEIDCSRTGPREIWALHNVLRRLQAEVVVVDRPRDLRLSAWATLFQGAKLVYRYNVNYRRPRLHLADRLYATRVAACVFQSRFIQEEARHYEPWTARRAGYRIPNGYDTNRYAPRPTAGMDFRKRWDIPDHAYVVLTSAKLAHNKGHELAIEALDRVRRQGITLIYLVCGDGPKDHELRRSVMMRDLPARFTGLLGINDLIAALSAADLVLHPSLQEIFPNAVGEAMACARAVVAVDAGGTAELLGRDGTTGVLVPPANPELMAEAVHALLINPGRRDLIGSAARRRIEAEFPLERMIDGYEAALRKVVAARG